LDRLWEEISQNFDPVRQEKEVGGMLMGTIQKNQDGVQIVVRLFVPLSCSYQDGCAYHLSADDNSAVQTYLDRCGNLLRWRLVGFYRSHCRAGMGLDDEDLSLARQHLIDPPGVLLLMKSKTVTADSPLGVLFVFDSKEFQKEPAYAFPFDPTSLSTANAGQPDVFELSSRPRIGGPDNVPEMLAALSDQLHKAPKAGERATIELRGLMTALARKRNQVVLAGGLVLLIAGLIPVWTQLEQYSPLANKIPSAQVTVRKMDLWVAVEADHVRITWNPHAPPISRATNGTLLVTDGQFHNAIDLNADSLRLGSIVYYPLTDVANFELRIGTATESVLAVGLEKARRARAVNEPANQQMSLPADQDNKGIRAMKTASVGHPLRYGRPILDRSKSLGGARRAELVRTWKAASSPPRTVPIQAMDLPPPPDLVMSGDSNLGARVQVPTLSTPPPAPAGPVQAAMPGPKEHIDYVAVQPVKQAAPQALPNLLRLLVSSVTIRVQVYVDAQGKVMRAESLSHGNALVDYLSNISVKAAREWQFRPARQGNRDVEGEIVLQFEFEGNRKTKDGS